MNQTILQQKQELVKTIADKIANAGSTVVVEYRGLTVAEVTELRRTLREEGCEMVVYKNSMTQRAVEELGYHDLLDSLKGPNAIAVSKDEIAASRILSKFAKKHTKLIVKAGIVENKVINAEEAVLPGCLRWKVAVPGIRIWEHLHCQTVWPQENKCQRDLQGRYL